MKRTKRECDSEWVHCNRFHRRNNNIASKTSYPLQMYDCSFVTINRVYRVMKLQLYDQANATRETGLDRKRKEKDILRTKARCFVLIHACYSVSRLFHLLILLPRVIYLIDHRSARWHSTRCAVDHVIIHYNLHAI